MKLIVAVDKNWGIGCEGKLLFDIPEDMKFFRTITTGKTVVMGRKTFESFPNQKPLPNRLNIVLTRQGGSLPKYDNMRIVNSFDELFKVIDSNSDDIYIIGGAKIYNQLLIHCDELLITKIDADGNADTFITNIDEHPNFVLSESSEWKEHNGLKYKFTKYTRKILM